MTNEAPWNEAQMDTHNRQFGYAGNISASEAWELLEKKADAVIVDVRTQQEWEQIGLPDLAPIGKDVFRVTWKMSPDVDAGALFVSEFSRLQVAQNQPVLLLCRSGGRSQAAAMALTQAGFSRCLNVTGGFEGRSGWLEQRLPSQK